MKDKAFCKINLALNVISRRKDGYHDLESIMVPLSFYDEVEINIADEDLYECDKDLPYDEHNTIYKAMKIMKERYDITDHHHISIKKNVPWEAGLGGGSADAAVTISIMSKLHDISLSREDIADICHKIGSDVIFTYYHKPAYASGTGEDLEFFDIKKDYHVLLIKPDKGISTKDAYGNLNLDICDHPDCKEILKKLVNGEDIIDDIANSLEQPSLLLCDDIREVKEKISEYGFKGVMSGSGSCVFVIDENKDKLLDLQKKMGAYFTFLCTVLK